VLVIPLAWLIFIARIVMPYVLGRPVVSFKSLLSFKKIEDYDISEHSFCLFVSLFAP
jgi:hypothetical protein